METILIRLCQELCMLGQTLVPVDDPALKSGLFSDTNTVRS